MKNYQFLGSWYLIERFNKWNKHYFCHQVSAATLLPLTTVSFNFNLMAWAKSIDSHILFRSNPILIYANGCTSHTNRKKANSKGQLRDTVLLPPFLAIWYKIYIQYNMVNLDLKSTLFDGLGLEFFFLYTTEILQELCRSTIKK